MEDAYADHCSDYFVLTFALIDSSKFSKVQIMVFNLLRSSLLSIRRGSFLGFITSSGLLNECIKTFFLSLPSKIVSAKLKKITPRVLYWWSLALICTLNVWITDSQATETFLAMLQKIKLIYKTKSISVFFFCGLHECLVSTASDSSIVWVTPSVNHVVLLPQRTAGWVLHMTVCTKLQTSLHWFEWLFESRLFGSVCF